MATITIDPADAAWEAYRQAVSDLDKAAEHEPGSTAGSPLAKAELCLAQAEGRLADLPGASQLCVLRKLQLVKEQGLDQFPAAIVASLIRDLKAELGR
jgi:hypothetical protein